jgi:DNA-binding NarL/FixJ family response regulator
MDRMHPPIRLLIADDSDAVRRAICTLLEHESNIKITAEASSYTELLGLLTEPIPEVVLMDVHMPDENQFDAGTIKAHFGSSCLLAMSIFADEETARLAQSYGAFKLLDKVGLALTLLPAIEECTREKGNVQNA